MSAVDGVGSGPSPPGLAVAPAGGSCAAAGCAAAGSAWTGRCRDCGVCRGRDSLGSRRTEAPRRTCCVFPARASLPMDGAGAALAARACVAEVLARAHHWQQIIGGLKLLVGPARLDEVLQLHGCVALRCAQTLAAGFPFEAVWTAAELEPADAARGGITPLAYHAAGLLQEAILVFYEYYLSGLDPMRLKGAKDMAPIFVFGLPRSGTTAVQRLLALDEGQLRTLRRFEAAVPSTVLHGSDAARVEAYLRNLDHEAQATSRDFHSTKPLDVAETSDFFASGLTSTAAIVASGASPGAEAWLRYIDDRDDVLLLEYLRLFLELSTWRDAAAAQREAGAGAGAGAGAEAEVEANNANQASAGPPRRSRRWVLKDPLHCMHLDAILEVFPAAKFVWCHRDLRQTLRSSLSQDEARGVYGARQAAVEKLEHRMRSAPGVLAEAVAFRAKVRAKAPLHFADVFIDDVNEDPAAAVAKLYADLGLQAPEGHAKAVRAFAEENPAPPPRQLRGFIEDADGMNERFSHYVDAFPRMRLKPAAGA